MPKKCPQHKVNNILALLFTKDQYGVWRSLALVPLEDVLQHLYAHLDLALPLDHRVEQEIHYCEQGADFFIRVSIFHAEVIIYGMEF